MLRARRDRRPAQTFVACVRRYAERDNERILFIMRKQGIKATYKTVDT